MCKPNAAIHFCTCATVSKKPLPPGNRGEVDQAEYEKTHYIWTLYKYLGEKDSLMMGDMVMPVDSLDEELTSQYVLQQLNSQNRFDFDYSPSEGDNLQIRKEYVHRSIRGHERPDLYDYLSFTCRSDKWKEEVYNVFTDKIGKIKAGIVKSGENLSPNL